MALIDKKTLEHLASLSRLELDEEEKKRLLGDLENILDHFKELKELNTDDVVPMAGGTSLFNVLLEDNVGKSALTGERAVAAFPEKEKSHLKVPPVFSTKGGSISDGE